MQARASASKAAIKPIDKGAVHRICSGQVIIDLAGAVKELLENSLDAGATAVDIKLRGFGANAIEVSDNGSGVAPENYQGLTRKYCTSKLREFNDLQYVSTFGFRGEALSSLCALSKLSVCTRTRDEDVGTLLFYNPEGEIEKRVAKARSVGTTVTLTSLFESLPVRHREFQKNIKKEFTKLVNLLQAYAIICVNVRITCQNEKSGKWTRVLATNGKEMRDNIISVFGPSMSQQILPISKDITFQTNKGKKNVSMNGFLSKPMRNTGRNNGNRQFIFVNNRPLDYPRLTKVMNEIYRQANPNQYPLIFLNFTMPTDYYDVNVTPDKRTILLHDETLFLEALKIAVSANYCIEEQHTFKKNAFGSLTNFDDSFDSQSQEEENKEFEEEGHYPNDDDGDTSTFTKPYPINPHMKEIDDEEGGEEHEKEREKEKEQERENDEEENGNDEEKENEESEGNTKNGGDTYSMGQRPSPLNRFAFTSTSRLSLSPSKLHRTLSAPSQLTALDKNLLGAQAKRGRGRPRKDEGQQRKLYGEGEDFVVKIQKEKHIPNDAHARGIDNGEGGGSLPSYSVLSKKRKADEVLQKVAQSIKSSQAELDKMYSRKRMKMSGEGSEGAGSDDVVDHDREGEDDEGVPRDTADDGGVIYISDDNQVLLSHLGEQPELSPDDDVVIDVDLEAISKRIAQRNSQKQKEENGMDEGDRFQSDLQTDSTEAEEELRRVFNKQDFENMKVIGQFNLGFIIARSGDDIFIVDQHASDEKYNFETLQKTTTINKQPLICPKPLELTAIEEVTVTDNMWIFNKNGFYFTTDESAPGCKLKLSAIPYSKNKEFGLEDVYELIAQLDEFPGEMCRLSRVTAMFASRACRMSIMIGTALSTREMQRVLTNMSTIDNPWSCPHGRPTMRHLFSLSSLQKKREEEAKAKQKTTTTTTAGLVKRLAKLTLAYAKEKEQQENENENEGMIENEEGEKGGEENENEF